MAVSSAPVSSRLFSVPKAGTDPEEYEDAAAVRTDAWPVRAAVADGATESIFARRWARILVEGMVEATAVTPDAVAAALPAWQAEWENEVAARMDALPWYGRAKASDGAFATLLGMEVFENGSWRAVAVGDSCVLHVRNGEVETAWPFATPEAFDSHPMLLPTREDRAVPTPLSTTGAWKPGDVFLLATDAVAEGLLRTKPAFGCMSEPDVFRNWVEAARTAGRLRNDDATLLILRMSEQKTAEDQ